MSIEINIKGELMVIPKMCHDRLIISRVFGLKADKIVIITIGKQLIAGIAA